MISAIDFPTENDQNFNDDLKFTEVKVSSGKLLLYDKFPSNLISQRKVYVWLPDYYSEKKKYDVVYMHDGQMLFDERDRKSVV